MNIRKKKPSLNRNKNIQNTKSWNCVPNTEINIFKKKNNLVINDQIVIYSILLLQITTIFAVTCVACNLVESLVWRRQLRITYIPNLEYKCRYLNLILS